MAKPFYKFLFLFSMSKLSALEMNSSNSVRPEFSAINFTSNDDASRGVSTEELVALAITDIVSVAKAKGSSYQELERCLLADDKVLDKKTRIWLSQVVASVWESIDKNEK